jgi:hypothetical protein
VTDKGEIVYNVLKTEKEDTEFRLQDTGLRTNQAKAQKQDVITKTVALKETLEGSKDATLTGVHQSETRVNYFKGKKEDWRTNIPTWQEVSLGEIYEGIKLGLRAHGKNVEKIFTVLPGGSVGDINLSIEGAKGLNVNKDGILEVETDLGVVTFTKPVAYQEIKGKRIEVPANYILQNSKLTYGFQVAKYDRSKPLIIDPVLSYSTYLGGSNIDSGSDIELDTSGNIYIGGVTGSSTGFTTVNPFDGTYGGGDYDAFVAKIDGSSGNLIYSTYLGGDGTDYANDIAVDTSGNVYIGGPTNSTDFPVFNWIQETFAGGEWPWGTDGFVTKLHSSGSSLIFSTYLGGSSNDNIGGLAIDTSGNVYVAGYTFSLDYPMMNAYQPAKGNLSDIFISKIHSSGKPLLYSTYLGGNDREFVYEHCIIVDASENIYLSGSTISTDYQ